MRLIELRLAILHWGLSSAAFLARLWSDVRYYAVRLSDVRDLLLSNSPRMGGWWLIAIVLGGVIWWIAPQQMPVAAYKLSLVAMAAVAGYWIDRCAFPYARPHSQLVDVMFAAATLRRAIIIGCTMLAVGLGV